MKGTSVIFFFRVAVMITGIVFSGASDPADPAACCTEGYHKALAVLVKDVSCQPTKSVWDKYSSMMNQIMCKNFYKSCCRNAAEVQFCKFGERMAMANQLCIKSPKIGGGMQAECCDCCKKGRRAAKEYQSCTTSFDGYCKESFTSCCKEMQSKMPTTKSPPKIKTCKDVQCDHVSTKACVEGINGAQCLCKDGFAAMNDDVSCLDINECKSANNKCPDKCINTPGSYTCGCVAGMKKVNDKCVSLKDCERGYEQKDGECADIDECLTKKHRCPRNSFCMNTPGSYRCLRYCKAPNLLINPTTRICEDVDECKEGTHKCNKFFKCINTIGNYDCKRVSCYDGYKLVNEYCEDVDECKQDPERCGEKGSCRNVAGTYYCDCQTGYSMSETTGKCEDTDECKLDQDYCQYKCINTIGSYRCSCPKGYEVRGKYCYDFNECQQANRCENNEFCYNNYGSFACINESCLNQYYVKSQVHHGSPSSCRKIDCNEIEECKNNPLQSVKRLGYKFLNNVPMKSFVFTYSTGFNRKYYDVRSKLTSGNDEGLFRIHYINNNKLQVINQRKIVGPKSVKLVLQTDIITLRRSVLTWRYEYHFYIYVSEHHFT